MSLFNDTQTTDVKADTLVGEDKKFKTVDDLAKAKIEADNFIERLKSELTEARKEITARPPAVDRSQEILDQLEALKNAPVTERQPHQEPERTEVTVKGLSVEDVDRIMNEREARATATKNINFVKDELKKKFGDNYDQALKSLSEKNGLSAADLDGLAARSPQAILNLVGGPSQERIITPPNSSAQVTGFKPTADGHKPRSWWNEMKERDRKSYFSPEMQMRQYKDAMALKEAFEDIS